MTDDKLQLESLFLSPSSTELQSDGGGADYFRQRCKIKDAVWLNGTCAWEEAEMAVRVRPT